MRIDLFRRFSCAAIVLILALPLRAQQTSDTFRWIDFHAAEDQNIVHWIESSLVVEKWSAIREIGVVYDAALVVTTTRATEQSSPNSDAFTIWNVSLTTHAAEPLLRGYNLRWYDWQHFAEGGAQELTVLYENCAECSASTYFTAFRYDLSRHAWTGRWLRGGQGVLVWNAISPSAAGVALSQVYAVIAGPGGRAYLATWNHLDYGKQKPANDTVFRFDVDPMTGMERTVDLTGDEAEAMQLRLCRGQDTIQGLSRGQDSPLCQQLLGRQPQRHPVTTPPANNRGRSTPPAGRR